MFVSSDQKLMENTANHEQNKRLFMTGLETDNEYSSSEHSYDEEIINSSVSSRAPTRSSSIDFMKQSTPLFSGSAPNISAYDSAFSERTLKLLQTRDKYPDPTKRLLSIWNVLYNKKK